MLVSKTKLDYGYVKVGPGFIPSHLGTYNNVSEHLQLWVESNIRRYNSTHTNECKLEIFRVPAHLCAPQHNRPTTRERTPGGI